MWLSSVTLKVALVPLNLTLVAPVKRVPVTVTPVPAAPLEGEKLVMPGPGMVTVKLATEEAVPFVVVTETLPVVAPFGTVAAICVALLTVNVAAIPLKATALAPVRLVPAIVTLLPLGPLAGEKLEIVGAVFCCGGGGVLAPPAHPVMANAAPMAISTATGAPETLCLIGIILTDVLETAWRSFARCVLQRGEPLGNTLPLHRIRSQNAGNTCTNGQFWVRFDTQRISSLEQDTLEWK
jgi:hypothetical protein